MILYDRVFKAAETRATPLHAHRREFEETLPTVNTPRAHIIGNNRDKQ